MRRITDLAEIQDILFENLINFKNVCSKNHLRFYLSNGTLLGAVKYKGFIPWDDDIDVFMPREDYDRLMKVTDFDDGIYELMAKEKDPRWRVPYAKIKDKRTYVQETTADFGVENGLSIDVFPLDNWSEHKKRAVTQARYCGLMRRFLTASIEKTFKTPRTGIKKFILFMIWKYSHFKGTDYFYNKIMKVIREENKSRTSQYQGSVAWSLYGEKEVIPSDIFLDVEEVTFRGEQFFAPSGYDAYLRNLYGDYEQDPPAERQKSHHNIKVWWKNEY